MDTPPSPPATPDLVCFSHLRWDFVYQRPQHLMSRFARTRRVSFLEEPVFESTAHPHLRVTPTPSGVTVVVPVLAEGTPAREAIAMQRELFGSYISEHCGAAPTFWLQTPMALPLAPAELADVVIYDCMDELSAFHGASPSLLFNEKQLLARADLVFTGGRALYEAKRTRHPDVHCFPSGIDRAHFATARAHRHEDGCLTEFRDMPPGTRVGFAGVIDERLDIDLLAAVADARPGCQFVMIGPVVKIDPGSLPQRANIHYLGMRGYDDLPAYMGEWDVAMMPFARNAATRFISPTKTPEYLSAGVPVVSTSILDVVRTYGTSGLVAIADEPAGFAAAIDAAVHKRSDPDRLRAVDAALAQSTWESVWEGMAALERARRTTGRVAAPVPASIPAGSRARAQ
jgi:UDP-galactopyranose mutase